MSTNFFFRQTIVLKSLFSPSFFDDRDKGEGDTAVLHSKHRTTYFVKTNLWMVELNAPSLGTKCKQMPCGLQRSSTVFDAIHNHASLLLVCLFVMTYGASLGNLQRLTNAWWLPYCCLFLMF